MNTLKDLLALGFTPSAALAIVASMVLWLHMEMKDRKGEAARQAWHNDTRAQVEEMRGHVDACNDDREKLTTLTSDLKVEVATLTERVQRMTTCPSRHCPLRQPMAPPP